MGERQIVFAGERALESVRGYPDGYETEMWVWKLAEMLAAEEYPDGETEERSQAEEAYIRILEQKGVEAVKIDISDL